MRFALIALLWVGAPMGSSFLEWWLHRRASARMARFAFVPVGTQRLARVDEPLIATRETYRGGDLRRGPPRLPMREWALRGPNEGTVDVSVDPSRHHAVVRLDVPYKRGSDLGQKPTRATATLRIEPARDDDGYYLRALALPPGLFVCAALPCAGAAIALLEHQPGVFLFSLLGALLMTSMFQHLWWLVYGYVVRESAALALAALADAVEAEAAPPSGESTTRPTRREAG